MSEPLTPERLAEIEAREKAASAGPWRVMDLGENPVIVDTRFARHLMRVVHRVFALDLAFSAHARLDVPDLLAEVRRLRERDALLEAALRPFAELRRVGIAGKMAGIAIGSSDPQMTFYAVENRAGTAEITAGDFDRAVAALDAAEEKKS